MTEAQVSGPWGVQASQQPCTRGSIKTCPGERLLLSWGARVRHGPAESSDGARLFLSGEGAECAFLAWQHSGFRQALLRTLCFAHTCPGCSHRAHTEFRKVLPALATQRWGGR